MAYKSILTAAGVTLCLMSAPMAAVAQDTPTLTAETVTDEHVEAFVRAAIALEALRKEYTDKIGNATTEEAQNELRAEVDRFAVQLVDKAKGITADEYLIISKAAQTDEELAGRIAAQVDVMRAQKAEFDKQQAEAARAQAAQAAAEAQKAAQDTAKEATTTE